MQIAKTNTKIVILVADLQLKRKFVQVTSKIEEADDPNDKVNDKMKISATSVRMKVPIHYHTHKSSKSSAYCNKARSIQQLYTEEGKIAPDKRKLLCCGSSLVLDLINQSSKKCFTETGWLVLIQHFEQKLKFAKGRS